MKRGEYTIMNLAGSRLVDLRSKGNLDYAEELYNPMDFFSCVHHVSFYKSDRDIKFRNSTIKTHTVGVFHLGRIMGLLLYLFQVIRIARREKVCLIRGRAPYYESLVGLLASRVCKVPFVVSIGGNHRMSYELDSETSSLFKLLGDSMEAFVLKGADKVICPNLYSKKYVVDIGVSPDKVSVIPLMLKNDVYNFGCQDSDILVKNGVSLDKPIILFVGRLNLYKQVDVLIETIPLVTKECPEIQFVLVGGGPLKDKLEQRVVELGESSRVFFLGFQPTETVKYCFSVATAVCVLMSGFVMYEAASASKAIIAFGVEWHSEFIEDGKTGLLVENRNRDKLAEAIKRLVVEPQLVELLGKNAREAVDMELDPKKVAKKEIDELLSLIRKEGGYG